MTTITIERALLEQVQEFLYRVTHWKGGNHEELTDLHDMKETIKAALAAPATAPEQPAWQDAPTCAGVWVNSISGRVNVVIEETLSAWQHSGARYYGPIPSDSGDRP